MKKNLLKRIGAVALALAVSLTMGTSAFAVNSDGTKNDDNGIESSDTTIGIAKQMVFINDENTTVREPNITYTYTISSATPGTAKVTDKDGMTGTVKAGIMSAVTGATTATTSTVEFKDTVTSDASAAGTSTSSKYANFTFDPTKFLVSDVLTPGIYRYKISEGCNPTKASVGVEEATGYSADRYLDVYVKWNNDRTALAIYGYVLSEDTASTSFDASANPKVNIDKKSPGYVNTAESGDAPADVDVYKTENLYINKVTTGSLADANNLFPISLTLTAPSGVTAPKMDVATSNGGTLTVSSGGAYINSWGAVTGSVKNTSQIAIKGIPAGAKASVVETNNTPDSYKVKAGTEADAEDLLKEAIVAAGSNAKATSDVALTSGDEVVAEIDFTNTLDTISPTNVVMRFAPYLFILGAAIVLLVVMRRRRAAQDAE